MMIPMLLVFLIGFGGLVLVGSVLVRALRAMLANSCGGLGYRRSYYSDGPSGLYVGSSSYESGVPPVMVVHHMVDGVGQPVGVDSGSYVPADSGGSVDCGSSSFDSGSSSFDSGGGSCDSGGGGGCDCGSSGDSGSGG